MMPIDGNGYGKSQYWEYKAREIANKQDEGCKHLSEHLPKVTFKYDSKANDDFYLRFRVKCPKCRHRFYATEKILINKFMEFYGQISLSDKEMSREDLEKL
jgi:hypothetical protein